MGMTKLSYKKNPRTSGIVMMCFGVIGGWIYVQYLLSQAEKHVQEITVYWKLIFLADILGVIGLFLAVFGDKASSLLQMDKENLTMTNVLVLLILVAIGFAGYYLVLCLLDGAGYR